MTAPVDLVPPPHSSARNSALIGAGIFLSRILGLVRQRLLAQYLGAGLVSDAFNGAFRLTNFLQNLFGEGALSASFIPVYAQALERGDDDTADRIAGAVAGLLALVTAIIVVIGMIAAPAVVAIVAGGFEGEKRELTIRLTRILFPGAGIFVMSAWCLGILNSHRRFFLSYAAPVFWNIAMIVALVAFGPRRNEVELAVLIGWASVIGAALQMGVQLPTVFRLLGRPRFSLDHGFAPVRSVVRNFVPAFVSRGVVQVSAFVDIRIASEIMSEGVVTLMQNAQTIYMLPISLFGMSSAAAELPEMSRAGGAEPERNEALRARLNAALPRVAFFVIPSAIGFIVLGEAIAQVLLEGGKFLAADSARTWAILAGSGIGLLASAMGRLYSSTFYALGDTRTPLRFAVARVLFTASVGYVFAIPLPGMLGLDPWTGAVGLAISGGLAAMIEFFLLRRAITRRIGSTAMAANALAKVAGAAVVAAAAGWAVMRLLDPAHRTLRGAIALGVFAAIYGMISLVLRVPEARKIAGKVLRR